MNGNSAPVGFQNTEIGVFPEDWHVTPLRNIVVLMTNGFVGVAKTHYVSHGPGITYIQGFNVLDGRFNLFAIKRVTEKFHAEHQRSCLRAGDMLTVQTGDVGLTTVVTPDLAGANCHALIIMRFKSSAGDSRFYMRLFNSSSGRQSLRTIETGTTMKHLNVGDMLDFVVPVPPLKEQIAIADALDSIASTIYALERLIAKKQAIKQGMMQQLLTGKTRLPGFSGAWRDVKLHEVASMGSGGTPSSKTAKYYGGSIPWVSIADMTSTGKYIKATEKMLTQDGISSSAAKLYEPDVVLYAMYASLGECSIAVGKVSSSQAILGISPGRSLDREFLYYYLTSIKSIVKDMGQQGTQSNLNAGMVRNFDLRLPALDEQFSISALLIDVDNELDGLAKRLEVARSVKQGMMQELLTGRTRLQPAEAMV